MVRLYFTIRFLQIISPPVLRFVGFMLSMTLVTLVSIWRNINQSASSIADYWVDRAVSEGFITIWTPHLYYTVKTIAYLMMLVGWVILAHITVWLTKWMF